MLVNSLLAIDSIQEVTYLSEDSRDIRENTMFFCLSGEVFDGHNVVDDVISRGAKVIVHTKELVKKEGIVYYQTDDIEAVMSDVANKFYNYSSKKLNLIGITGTNGKTTTGWIIYTLLNRLELTSGYVGTIDIEYDNEKFTNLFTTPKPLELNYHLNRMVEKQIKYCALEVSSHALIKKRVSDLSFKYGIMTNLTFEHINFHKSMENYQLAKRMLFEQLSEDAYAILNIDDETYNDYASNTKAKVISYGQNNQADVKISEVELKSDSSSFTLIIENNEYKINTNLVAIFNIYNLVAALIVLFKEGIPLEKIIPLLVNIELPLGRMNSIECNQGFKVIVDYAHTPDGFQKVFEYAKTIAKGDIIAVFGSAGGNRDREKRPVLGEIASRYVDKIILTQDDQREEDVMEINKEILSGITISNVELDSLRSVSVERVIREAKKGDVILLLSKANDNYNIGPLDVKEPYEGDINIVKRILKERGYCNE